MQIAANRALVAEHAFVNRQSAENQYMVPLRERTEHRVDLFPIANSGSSAFGAQFQQHVQLQPALAKEAPELLHILGGIDQGKELEFGVLQNLRDRSYVLLAYELIGH